MLNAHCLYLFECSAIVIYLLNQLGLIRRLPAPFVGVVQSSLQQNCTTLQLTDSSSFPPYCDRTWDATYSTTTTRIVHIKISATNLAVAWVGIYRLFKFEPPAVSTLRHINQPHHTQVRIFSRPIVFLFKTLFAVTMGVYSCMGGSKIIFRGGGVGYTHSMASERVDTSHVHYPELMGPGSGAPYALGCSTFCLHAYTCYPEYISAYSYDVCLSKSCYISFWVGPPLNPLYSL